MGLRDRLGGTSSSAKSEDDFRDVTDADVSPSTAGTGPAIKSAEVSNQNELIPVKDEAYEGNIVLIDMSDINPGSSRWERVENELVELIDEIGGDIALRGDSQCIIAPAGIDIDRDSI